MITIEWLLVYLSLGAVVGFLAGLLGVGGGGMLVPVLSAIFLAQGMPIEQVVQLGVRHGDGLHDGLNLGQFSRSSSPRSCSLVRG